MGANVTLLGCWASAECSSGYLFAWTDNSGEWHNFYVTVSSYGRELQNSKYPVKPLPKHARPSDDIVNAALHILADLKKEKPQQAPLFAEEG